MPSVKAFQRTVKKKSVGELAVGEGDATAVEEEGKNGDVKRRMKVECTVGGEPVVKRRMKVGGVVTGELGQEEMGKSKFGGVAGGKGDKILRREEEEEDGNVHVRLRRGRKVLGEEVQAEHVEGPRTTRGAGRGVNNVASQGQKGVDRSPSRGHTQRGLGRARGRGRGRGRAGLEVSGRETSNGGAVEAKVESGRGRARGSGAKARLVVEDTGGTTGADVCEARGRGRGGLRGRGRGRGTVAIGLESGPMVTRRGRGADPLGLCKGGVLVGTGEDEFGVSMTRSGRVRETAGATRNS